MCLGSSARKPPPLPVLRGWPRVSVPRTPFPLQPWLSRKMKKMERGRREVEGEGRSLCSPRPAHPTHAHSTQSSSPEGPGLRGAGPVPTSGVPAALPPPLTPGAARVPLKLPPRLLWPLSATHTFLLFQERS